VITEYRHYLANPLDFFKVWEGGLVFYGGLLLAVPVSIYYIRKQGVSVLKVADVFAPYIALGHGIGRLGCFSAGCCFGNPTNLPCAVTFTDPNTLAPVGIPLHPTQLYEAFGNFCIFLILISVRKKQSYSGQIFFLYGVLYSFLRFVNEMFRGRDTKNLVFNSLSASQLISILLFIFSISMLFYLRKKQKRSV
jgi:phosphatidylglycerol:prolipoprotein diacylglycerol transferase